MAGGFGSNLAGNPFPLSSLYIPLSALWQILGDRDCHKPSFCRNSLVFRQMVYPLGIFLGNDGLVGDGGAWNLRRNFASFPCKYGRPPLRNKGISPKITIEGWNLG